MSDMDRPGVEKAGADWCLSADGDVATFDEALVWVVQKASEGKLTNPHVHIQPYWTVDEDGDGEYKTRYAVNVSGKVSLGHPSRP